VTKQLHKLVNVLKIRDMEPEETIAREMALFRVTAAVENRAEVMQFAEIFRATIVDVSRKTLTIEVTGSQEKIDAFERMIRPHGLVEMARTGEVAITRSRPEQQSRPPKPPSPRSSASSPGPVSRGGWSASPSPSIWRIRARRSS